MSSPLCAGNSRYRVGGPQGSVDTVYLGVFRRAPLEALGGWDEALLANEDYELNWRLREQGLTVWFDPALKVGYQPRENLTALASQYFGYGRWKVKMLIRHPRSLRARQLAAPLLVAGFAVSPGLLLAAPFGAAKAAAAALPIVYLLSLFACSAAMQRRRAGIFLVMAAAATIHFSWGTGFLIGLPAALRRFLAGRRMVAAGRSRRKQA